MNGLTPGTGAVAWTEPDPDWQIVGTGDLDGDGKADLVWRHQQSGMIYGMLMDGTAVKVGGVVHQEPDTNWRIATVADFDGDGKADLLWRHEASGQVYVMKMDGLNAAGGAGIWTEPDPNWVIAGTGDFDGDGKADILWRNASTGMLYAMQMDGTTVKGGKVLHQESDLSWKLAALVDLDGDGTTDLVFRNDTTGLVYGLPVKGAEVQTGAVLWNEPNLDWQIVGSGDYDGDGKGDLLWANAKTGQVFEQQCDGLSVKASGLVWTEADTTWQLLRTENPVNMPLAGPVISSFTATPTVVAPGGKVTLKAEYRGGTGVVTPGDVSLMSGVSSEVKPSTTTTYTLSVTGSGRTMTRNVTVQVPELSSNAPATVAYGSTMTFQVSTTVPVGGFQLEYGPTGMTVSPEGQVSWPVDLPMFGPTLEVAYSIQSKALPDLRLKGKVTVSDPGRKDVVRRTGIEAPQRFNGLQVVDMDGDGKAEILMASRLGLMEFGWNGAACEQRWAAPCVFATSNAKCLLVQDVTGDGRPDVLFSAGETVVLLDGATRREIARFGDLGTGAVEDLKLADLDGDGKNELICLTTTSGGSGSVLALNAATLTLRWRVDNLRACRSMGIGQVDLDPALDIVLASGQVINSKTQAITWDYANGFGMQVACGKVDASGIDQIVGLADWNGIRGYRADYKSPIWEVQTFDNDSMVLVDLDGDGLKEILVGDGQWGDVTVYRYKTSLNALEIVGKMNSQDHGVSALAAGDVNGDGKPELVWGTGLSSTGEDHMVLAGMQPSMSLLWTNVAPAQLDGPFIGGCPVRLGNGIGFIFMTPKTDSGYEGARLLLIDSNSHALTISPELGSNWSRLGKLDIMDIEGDGVDEVVLATANLYDEYLTMVDPRTWQTLWTSPTKIGDVVALSHADCNGDGAPDILALTGDGYLTIFDAKNNQQIWKSIQIGGNGLALGASDLDGDGKLELIVLTTTRLVVYRQIGGPIGWVEANSLNVSGGKDMVLGGTEQDPLIHVLLSSSNSNTLSLKTYSKTLGEVSCCGVPPSSNALHMLERRADRSTLVITGNALIPNSYSTSLSGVMTAVDSRTGAVIWKSPEFWGDVQRQSLHVIPASQGVGPRFVFGTNAGMFITQ